MQKTVVRIMALLLVVLMCLTLLPIRSWAEAPCEHPGLGEDGWTIASYPTCTAPGKKTQFCDDCSQTVERSIPIDPSAHDYVDIAGKNPTCGAAGYTAYKICKLCSHIEGKTEIAATGEHSFIEDSALAHVATAADCTHRASYYKVCSVCGAVSDSDTFESGEPLGHDMQPVAAVAAKCDIPGHEAYEECTRCHQTNPETPATIPALEHQWGDWTATSSLSCTTPRVEERTCTRDGCGQKERREIPAPGHNFFNNVCTNPNCGATRASIKVTVNGDAIVKMAGEPITADQELFVEPGTINIDILPATGNEVKSASVNGTAISVTGNRISVPVEAGTACRNIVITAAASSSDTELIVTPTSKVPKKDRTAPAVSGLWSINDGRIDKDALARRGRILGSTTEMLYRRSDQSAYSKITEADQPVVPGTYYVKYAANDTYNESLPTEVFVGNYYTVTADHLYGKGTYYTNRDKYPGYSNVFLVAEGGSISFTFTPDSGYWLHEINVNGTYVGSGYVSRNYKIPSVTKRTVVSFGFSSSTSSPKTADPNQDILTWGIAEIVSLIGMTTITWYLFRRKEY